MECDFPAENASDSDVKSILDKYNKVAVVGLSSNPEKDSFRVAEYLLNNGYEVIPINPKSDEILGKKVYRSLKDIPDHVEIVCLFRPSEHVPPFVDDAIEIEANVVWMQLGIVNNDSAEKARNAGLEVVMNKCIKIEHANFL
ncbi:MAG: CoA-binding protein [bacterium]|nr:CoA-binding protein [bacterium]